MESTTGQLRTGIDYEKKATGIIIYIIAAYVIGIAFSIWTSYFIPRLYPPINCNPLHYPLYQKILSVIISVFCFPGLWLNIYLLLAKKTSEGLKYRFKKSARVFALVFLGIRIIQSLISLIVSKAVMFTYM